MDSGDVGVVVHSSSAIKYVTMESKHPVSCGGGAMMGGLSCRMGGFFTSGSSGRKERTLGSLENGEG